MIQKCGPNIYYQSGSSFLFLCFWHINCYWLFNAKVTFLEEQLWYYLTHSWEDKRVHTFSKGTCPKVNVIAQLEFELAYYDSVDHRFNHYTTIILQIRGRMNLREVAMKYSTFPKALGLEPHHQMQFNVILRTLVVTLQKYSRRILQPRLTVLT